MQNFKRLNQQVSADFENVNEVYMLEEFNYFCTLLRCWTHAWYCCGNWSS